MKTIEILKKELSKPSMKDQNDWDGSNFDPWFAFPCFYGSYSKEFDDMAILVLENLLNKESGSAFGEELAHEMFREVLCTSDLCDYGTSPRVCFPTREFEELLPELIEKWKEYSKALWGC